MAVRRARMLLEKPPVGEVICASRSSGMQTSLRVRTIRKGVVKTAQYGQRNGISSDTDNQSPAKFKRGHTMILRSIQISLKSII